MNRKILFISDYFVNQITGGGELNDWELINILKNSGNEINYLNSSDVSVETILKLSNSGYKFIVSNFINLSSECISALSSGEVYAIYEHDHKYLKTRNPMMYPEFKAPIDQIINIEFYKKAKAVFCQSSFHKNIIKKNLEIDNIVSLGGNLWSLGHLKILDEVCSVEKTDSYAVIDYKIPHKNTHEAIRYCNANKIEYDLIRPSAPDIFLRKMGKNKTLLFFPKSPETLSRIVVEARMMGMSTKTTQNIGAVHEEWFSKKGKDLIDIMRKKRSEIPALVLENLYG
mgnify:FL=1|tara:strand:+ start:156 stop:1010 length:855 start_codon:yes stop_codon:yes gene_type:complete